MLARIEAGEQKEVAVLIKADVQGSAEAIQATVLKLAHEEVKVRVLLAAVGQITESDVQLAKASSAVIIAFNVRATAQARELAQRDGVDIRYYSIIYEVADDIEKLVRGKVAPKARERFLGYAEIRKVFNITKTGKVAGCMVTEGLVKRGAGVRLLRDNVVIHSGELSQLKRFKDDVREVARGYECGLSFANFHDLQEGDVVECFEVGDGAGLRKQPSKAPRRSGNCAWRRKSATCWRASSPAATSATRISPGEHVTVTEVRISSRPQARDRLRRPARPLGRRRAAAGAEAGGAVPADPARARAAAALRAGPIVPGGHRARLRDEDRPAAAPAGGGAGFGRQDRLTLREALCERCDVRRSALLSAHGADR